MVVEGKARQCVRHSNAVKVKWCVGCGKAGARAVKWVGGSGKCGRYRHRIGRHMRVPGGAGSVQRQVKEGVYR